VTTDFIFRLLPPEIQASTRFEELESVLADLLYEGYIKSQRAASERIYNFDNLKIPEDFNFNSLSGLSNEMIERLERAKPQTFGQVRTIPGLTAAAVSTVLVFLNARRKPSLN
jgi:tRNA uridine 5-carboxymethylaminomethyl modification enzyme